MRDKLSAIKITADDTKECGAYKQFRNIYRNSSKIIIYDKYLANSENLQIAGT